MIESAREAFKSLLPGDILIDPQDFRAGNVQDAASSVDPLETNGFQRIEFKNVGSASGSRPLFGDPGVDLEISHKVVGQKRDLLVSAVSLVMAGRHNIESKLPFDFSNLVFHGAAAIVKFD